MSTALQSALDAALDLDDADRVRLAEEVLRSLDAEERGRIEQLWYAEAKRRFDAIDRGEMEMQPADEVFAALLKGRS